jgi:protein-disulfide isomerase
MRIRTAAFVLASTIGLAAAVQPGGAALQKANQFSPAPAQPPTEFERWYATQPRVYVPVDRAGAVVLIVKFSDYQCPPCAKSQTNDKPILARYEKLYPGAVRLVTKDFPLAPGCNPTVNQAVHAAACEAAVAVRLARRQHRGTQMEEWLFANQPTLTPDVVRQAARSVGGVADFAKAYAETLADVKSDAALGQALGVTQTPTFFINGVRFNGEPDPKFLDLAIAFELRNSAAQRGPVRR